MEEARASAEQLSLTDPLTGLANRRGMTRDFSLLHHEARRSGRLLGTLILDIDHFKQVNDRFGHDAGDVVLAEVGHVIREHCSGGDLVVRLGGEESSLVVAVHHTVFDGWSIGLMARELGALYAAEAAGEPAGLEELPVQFADYALWERERLKGESLAELTAYWRDEYDFGAFVERVNRFPQFRTEIDALGIHYLHVRSPHEGALPLLLCFYPTTPGCSRAVDVLRT